ncbi:MAG: 2Fe-2S iron-sulfur cluster-binding protein [Candidatus Puniceispirillales bacterium]
MPRLIFVNSEGTEKSVEAENGLSVMEIARDNDLDIEGTCGGSISCCTCHVIIDKDWFSIVGGPNPDEEDMLDLAVGLQQTSRLSCQIEVTNELDGLRMTIPEE